VITRTAESKDAASEAHAKTLQQTKCRETPHAPEDNFSDPVHNSPATEKHRLLEEPLGRVGSWANAIIDLLGVCTWIHVFVQAIWEALGSSYYMYICIYVPYIVIR